MVNIAQEDQQIKADASMLGLFVCLTGLSVRRHTWVLMGPDSNKMFEPG